MGGVFGKIIRWSRIGDQKVGGALKDGIGRSC